MKPPRCIIFLLALLSYGALCPALSAAWQNERSLTSPDGTHTFLLERDTATGALAWSVTHASHPVVTRGALGLELAGGEIIASRGAISTVDARSVDASWKPPFGERSSIPDQFREEILTLKTDSLDTKLQVRAYPEGIAFRYLVHGSGKFSIKSEKTTFPLPADATVWTSSTSQGKITRQPVSAIKGTVERPLTAELAPALFAAFGEAALTDQSRMKFALQDASTLLSTLDGPASFTDTFISAWRYVRAARSPAELLEGNYFVLNLNEPSKIADTSWLRPGKVLREVTLTTQGALASIDFASAHGFQYIMFDAGWYGHEYDDQASALAVNLDPKRSPGPLDLPAVIAAAKAKNIGVILYVNRRALEKQLDQILPLYQKWGVAGIKFGFVQTGSQRWTTWLHEAIEKCAKYKLMVNVHDDYRLTGVERTWPNLITAEGVRGDEETPRNEEVLNTLFTRSLTGAADQTNCYFAPRVTTMGSHASQLAKAVCLYSPWQFLFWYDRPPGSPGDRSAANVTFIQDIPELDFFRRLPAVWDETRVLEGYPGSHAVIARRRGETWFIGALNGATPRHFSVPLTFLVQDKNYRMDLFTDDPAHTTSTHVRIETAETGSHSIIRRSVAARNGFAAIITPELSQTTNTTVNTTKTDATESASIDVERIMKVAARKLAAHDSAHIKKTAYPTDAKGARWRTVPASDWVSGFYPGSLWYLYEYARESKWPDADQWRHRAEIWTAGLEKQQFNDSHHDTGFVIFNSFGHGYRLTQNPAYALIVKRTAQSLASRYRKETGMIRSWGNKDHLNNFRVIIDNMMNLELLVWSARNGGTTLDGSSEDLLNIATRHADRSAELFLRPDGGTYHVVELNPMTGAATKKRTDQGKADESTWSRGQTWMIYGFAYMYEATGNRLYLDTAIKAADYYLAHLPPDHVPPADFDSSLKGLEFKDSSAAAVAASALLRLQGLVDDPALKSKYVTAAVATLETLTDAPYFSEGADKASVLLYAARNYVTAPASPLTNTSLIWGDYYLLEALVRFQKMSRASAQGSGNS